MTTVDLSQNGPVLVKSKLRGSYSRRQANRSRSARVEVRVECKAHHQQKGELSIEGRDKMEA